MKKLVLAMVAILALAFTANAQPNFRYAVYPEISSNVIPGYYSSMYPETSTWNVYVGDDGDIGDLVRVISFKVEMDGGTEVGSRIPIEWDVQAPAGYVVTAKGSDYFRIKRLPGAKPGTLTVVINDDFMSCMGYFWNIFPNYY